MARIAAVACLSVALVACVGFGMAVAGGTVVMPFGGAQSGATASTGSSASSSVLIDSASDAAASEALTQTSSRDVSAGVALIEQEEEAARVAAEQKAIAEEQDRIDAAQAAIAKAENTDAATAMASLTDVDWAQGREAFIAEWTERINAYLEGFPLAGYGEDFATAAWENGVDPRWSPAISNTESTRGSNCFLPHNAWGWGASSWSSWSQAINAHVAGLAAGYGYTISYSNAQKYCPPNYDNWYRDTLGEMRKI